MVAEIMCYILTDNNMEQQAETWTSKLDIINLYEEV